MDCSWPGSSVHGILQARILEWVAIPFSRGSFQPGDQTHGSCITGRFFTTEPPGKLPCIGWERSKNSHKEGRELRWSLGQIQCRRGQAGAWDPFALFLTRQKWYLPAHPEPSVVLVGIQQTVALQIKVPLLDDSDLGHSPTASTPHPHCPRQ